MFIRMAEAVHAAVAPVLIDHCDRIMASHFKLPMEM